MSNNQNPFDAAAEKLEAMAKEPVKDQPASEDYWELNFAADESVGDYPQAVSLEDEEWDASEENWDDDLSEDVGLAEDGFPNLPEGLPKLQLQSDAKWTDVLSSTLWSEGYLLNDKALAAFQQCNLGDFRQYPAVVVDESGDERSYHFVLVNNTIEPSAIDFERAEFYIEDMLGRPQNPVEIHSFDDWLEMTAKANNGELKGADEFSCVQYKKLFFKPGLAPSVDLFTFSRLGVAVYISKRLQEAIVGSDITGLEIKPNRRVFRN